MINTNLIRAIDDLGRVIIPKTLRDKCGFEKGQKVKFYLETIDGEEYVCVKCPRPANWSVETEEE